MSDHRVSASVSVWPARVAPLLGCVAVRVRALVSALAALALALVSALPALVLRVLLRVLWRRLPARVRLSCRRCCAPACGCVLFLVLRPLRRVRLPSPRAPRGLVSGVCFVPAAAAGGAGACLGLLASVSCSIACCPARSGRACRAASSCSPCSPCSAGLGFGVWGRRAPPACRLALLSALAFPSCLCRASPCPRRALLRFAFCF